MKAPFSNLPVDYSADKYHQERHPDLMRSELLQVAWSEYASLAYFQFEDDRRRTIFEFGGALGYNLRALVGRHECHLLEPSEIGRSKARTLGIRTYAKEEDVPEIQFDSILCRHVLEHVDHPLTTLGFLRSRLSPSGTLILVLPLESWRTAPCDREIDFHLYCWNPRTACNLVQRAGMRVTSWRFNYFNGRRIALPIFRGLGASRYRDAISLIGRLTGAAELVLEIAL